MVFLQAFPALPPRPPLAFLSRQKLPFPSLSNACHAGYYSIYLIFYWFCNGIFRRPHADIKACASVFLVRKVNYDSRRDIVFWFVLNLWYKRDRYVRDFFCYISFFSSGHRYTNVTVQYRFKFLNLNQLI